MNLSTCRHKISPGDGKVTFPKQHSWNPLTKVATIAAEVNGKRILCRVSLTDLKKKFDAKAENPMLAVKEHSVELEMAARRLIEQQDFEEDGSILINYRDL